METSPRQRVLALAMAALLVAGSAGLALAAAPSTDDETTDTSYTTMLYAGNDVPFNDTSTTTHTFSADSKNASVTLTQNGTELGTWDNSSSKLDLQETVSGTSYYNFTFADDGDDFTGVEAAPGENVTLTLNRTNNTEVDNPDTSEIDFFWINDDNQTFARFGSGDVETAEPGSYASIKASAFSVFGDEVNLTNPAKAERSVDVAGENQDAITVYIDDEDAQAALDETYESSSDEGGVTFMSVAMVGDSFVPVMAEGEDVPDWVDSSEDTYIEVADGGEHVYVRNAGATIDSGAETTDVTVVGNEQANFFQITSMMSDYGASTLDQYVTAATNGELVTFGEQFDLSA